MVTVDYLVLGARLVQVDGQPAITLPGVGTVYLGKFPSAVNCVATFRLNIPWGDLTQETYVEFDVLDEEQHSTLIQRPSSTVHADPKEVDFPFEEQKFSGNQPLSAIAKKPGWYFVVLRLNGIESARASIRAVNLKGTRAAKAAGLE